jgi:uncharacterized NAD-dependent epimerase/dehydratase family protein
MRGLPGRLLPSLSETLGANLRAARLTNPDVVCIGAALNTSNLSPEEAKRVCARTADELGLPAQDPIAMGVDQIVDQLLECFAGSSHAANAGR